MIRRLRFFIVSCLLFCGLLPGCSSTAYSQQPEVKKFIQQMCTKHNFKYQELSRLFDQVRPQPRIITLMTAPHEALPWYRYRALFVTTDRAQQGARFWRQHAGSLAKAQQEYGVPAEIILAILGVETSYGKVLGSYRVLDSLSTLAFYYPPRAVFFKGELEQFLLLTREIPFDPLKVLGSYAGAIGQPQFMPSSYRRYAVDTDHKGYSNLINNTNDAIISVANYFKGYGWLSGQPVAVKAQVSGQKYQAFVNHPTKKLTVAEFGRYGVTPVHTIPANLDANLQMFEGEKGPEYWLLFHNFEVIMRYNNSPRYAMAVDQLGAYIKATYLKK